MDPIEAAVLGVIQGLTEFLPVSSSGHIELGKAVLGQCDFTESLSFTVAVHLATVLSTIVVFRNDILSIFKGLFSKGWNDDKKFAVYILVSMIPVGIAGVLFKENIEELFSCNLLLVGGMLMITGTLLLSTTLIKDHSKSVDLPRAVLIGLAQALAVLPGVSRSGSTIATGLLLKVDRAKIARFSFLMVIPPIIGIAALDIKELSEAPAGSIDMQPIIIGFITAFLTGWAACKVMINLVKKGKISWFAWYCFAAGIAAMGYHVLS